MQSRAKKRQQGIITLLIVTAVIFAIIGSISTMIISKYKAQAEAHYQELYANVRGQSRLEVQESIAKITEKHQKEVDALNSQIEKLNNENIALRETIQIASEVGVEVPFVQPQTVHWKH